jgi:hypothetical protein
MALTIFYSWQSDISNKINRNFIEDALKKAIKKVSKDFVIQEALRDDKLILDKDTKGVPGIPPIADVIFNKISQCGIFVPDLTFVGETKNGRLLPNPNVLVEYGWALKEVTHSRIVPVMNAAFGAPSWENLPFDMRHLRHPLTYHLNEDATPEERSRVKKELVGELTSAIEMILKKNLINEKTYKEKTFSETPYVTSPSTFIKKGEPLDIEYGEIEKYIIIPPNVAKIFLRLIPTSPTEEIKSSKVAKEMASAGQLMTMNNENRSGIYRRNKYGAYVYEKLKDNIIFLTQLFKNRELWGINTYAVNRQYFMKRENINFGYFPCVIFEDTFILTLTNYLKFASEVLKLPLPLRFIAGATDVEGYKMTAPPGMEFGPLEKFGGRCVENNIIYDGVIQNYGDEATRILRPFFNLVWEECGLERPDKERF